MTELANYPRVLITMACGLASFRVFLDSRLPFYVRDEHTAWVGYCNQEGIVIEFREGTLEELQQSMLAWWNDEEEKRNKGRK